MNHGRIPIMPVALALAVTIAGCRDRREPASPANPSPAPTARTADETPVASIIRPEVAAEPPEPAPPPPLEATVGFPDGGDTLDEQAEDALREVLESDQFAAGWPVVLRGHGDSAGSDEANMRVSRRRAETVAQWLIEQGVDEERITVIAFGGQNPVAPNARPDGTPNEAGRARNRRVEISIAPASGAADAEADVEDADEAPPDTA